MLSTADELWLRTAHHPIVAELPAAVTWRAFDTVYETAPTFDAVYEQIVAQVLELARRDRGVIYAVPGHPWVGESTVARLIAAARAQDIPVKVIAGLSFIEPCLTALGIDALDGLQLVDALDVVTLNHPPLNPDLPALIGQVYSRGVASELKLVLMNQYPDEHPVALIDAAGTDAQAVLSLPLYEIDRHEATAMTTLFVTPLPAVSGFEGFQETIARLRSPEGCPWDREQTHASLRANLLEESYEVLAAIDTDDPGALCEELGDLLLQIVLHAQIAVEDGEFQMSDVIRGIDAKLKHRHPHVWAGLQVEGVSEVISNWETIKRREREANGEGERSLLDGIPLALPALTQAHAYGARAERVGVGLQDPAALCTQAGEHLALLCAASAEDTGERSRVLGKLLHLLVTLSRRWGLDPESALRETNQRFAQHLRGLEDEARRRGVALAELLAENPDAL